MTDSRTQVWRARIGRAFWRGFAALLPTALTIALFVFVYRFIAGTIGAPINSMIQTVLLATGWGRKFLQIELHWRWENGELVGHFPEWVGILIGLVLVFAVGLSFTSWVGRRVWERVEEGFGRLPFVKAVYPSAKQMTEFFLGDKRVALGQPVVVEYPRKGVYTIAFVTGPGIRSVNEVAGREAVNVFFPTCPTPFTGMVVFVPKEDVHPIDMTVDETLKFIVSGGVIIPDANLPEAVRGKPVAAIAPPPAP